MQLSSDGVGGTLGTDTTIALCHWDGTDPDDSKNFIMSDNGTLSSKANISTSLLGTSSDPAADQT